MTPTTQDAYQLLHDGSVALSQVEQNGIRIDTTYLKWAVSETGEKIKTLQAELRESEVFAAWRKRYGQKTNLGSLTQLGEVLFNVLKVPYRADLTESNRFRTDEAVLSAVKLPFVQSYLRWEKYRKLKNTYLRGIADEVVDGYLHPFYNLHTVTTYRSSSSEPNFQNMPIRNPEFAEIIRKCFIPRKGCVLVERDFSGIEVRVACCYTKDPKLIEDFTQPGKDPHRDTAMKLFFLTQEQVEKKTTRDWTKNRFVFPQFYGSVYFQCAPHLWEAARQKQFTVPGTGKTVRQHLKENGVSRLGDCDPKQPPVRGTFEYQVQAVEKDFWNNRFKVYSQWKRDWYDAYLKKTRFDTLTGFRIGGLYRRNEVLNYPIQGSAFHCLLWSLIRLQKLLAKRKMKTKLVGQIHDSILADVPVGELDDYLDLSEQVTTRDLPKAWDWIVVPLATEVEVGENNWYEKREWVKQNGKWAAVAKG